MKAETGDLEKIGPLENGRLIAFSHSNLSSPFKLYFLDDSQGVRIFRENPTHYVCGPVWSPDGTKLVYQEIEDQASYYLADIETLETIQFAENADPDVYPKWSSDGQYLAYCARADKHDARSVMQLHIRDARTGVVRQLPGICQNAAWRADGKTITMLTLWPNGNNQFEQRFEQYDVESGHMLSTQSADFLPLSVPIVLSPDARYVAHIHSNDQRDMLHITTIEGSLLHQAEVASELLAWSPDSTKLLAYVASNHGRSESYTIFDLASGNLQLLELGKAGANSAAKAVWSPDGMDLAVILAFAEDNCSIVILNLVYGHPRNVLTAQGPILDLAWRPNAR